ncbi:MAG TPA: hypothetical protein VND65_18145 [Candidatus Binatia bacterium]|nr:hypothetical protein [Candidatus Binatia bacterium]
MPLTAKGREILGAMEQEYGEQEGKEVFYASANSGKITGVHDGDMPNPENLPGLDELMGPAGIVSLTTSGDELVEGPHLDPPAKPEIPVERVGYFTGMDEMPGQEYKAVETVPGGLTTADIAKRNREFWKQDDPTNPENTKQNENA